MGEKIKLRVDNQYKGLENVHHAQKSKKAQEAKKKTERIRAEFDKLTDYQKAQKGPTELAKIIALKLATFTDTDIEDEIISVTKAIKRFQHKEKLEKLSKHSIVDRDIQLFWPKRHLDDRDKDQENFSGEVKEFRRGNKAKLDKWVKSRAEIIKIQKESKSWDELLRETLKGL